MDDLSIDALRARYKALDIQDHQTLAFLSHHKGPAGKDARILKDKMVEILGIPKAQVFLDSDESHLHLQALLDRVRETKVVVFLQTKEVLFRPYVIGELSTAFNENIPVFAVNCTGGGYDREEANRFLRSKNFEAALHKRNPGASQILRQQGIPIERAAFVLREEIPRIPSKPLDTMSDTAQLDIQIKIIIRGMITAIEEHKGNTHLSLKPVVALAVVDGADPEALGARNPGIVDISAKSTRDGLLKERQSTEKEKPSATSSRLKRLAPLLFLLLFLLLIGGATAGAIVGSQAAASSAASAVVNTTTLSPTIFTLTPSTLIPSSAPSLTPSTPAPTTNAPSFAPSTVPTTSRPSKAPTHLPTQSPTSSLGTHSVAAGAYHSCALLSSGAVKCFGRNNEGQLGIGTFTSISTPTLVIGITNAIAVTAGNFHSCVLLSTGSIACFGANESGQLGNGVTGGTVNTPIVVNGISTAVTVSSGQSHNCAVLGSGEIKCWGYNLDGELGSNHQSNSSINQPVSVVGISTGIRVAAGNYNTCAVLSSGSVMCWGRSEYGALGNGSTILTFVPVLVTGISTALEVVAASQHACALLSSGTPVCWGANFYSQLGIGISGGQTNTPAAVLGGITNAVGISGSAYHTCVRLSAAGGIKCWGSGGSGELGNGTSTSSTPLSVQGGPYTVADVSAGGAHTCARLVSGSVMCFGYNNHGQLGNNGPGTPTPQLVDNLI